MTDSSTNSPAEETAKAVVAAFTDEVSVEAPLEEASGDKDYLDKLFGQEEPADAQAEAPVRARDESGKFTKAAPEAESPPQVKAKDEAKKGDEEKKASAEDGDDLEYQEALIALRRRARMTSEDIGKLGRERAIEIGKQLRSDQQAQDKLSGELAQRQRETEEARKTKKSDKPEAKANPALAEFDEKQLQPLLDDVGETAGKAITSTIKAMHGNNVALAAQLSEARSQLAEMQAQIAETASLRESVQQLYAIAGDNMAEMTRKELVDQFPGLKDKARYAKVRERMGKLASAEGAYSNPLDLMYDAATLEFRDELLAARETAKAAKARANGTPMRPTNAFRSKPSNAESAEEAAAEAAFRGEGRDGIMRALAGQ